MNNQSESILYSYLDCTVIGTGPSSDRTETVLNSDQAETGPNQFNIFFLKPNRTENNAFDPRTGPHFF